MQGARDGLDVCVVSGRCWRTDPCSVRNAMSIEQVQPDERIAVDQPDRSRVSLAGGVLVYESRALGRELIGFESVTDWDDLQDGLAARGHDRGAIYALSELDA